MPISFVGAPLPAVAVPVAMPAPVYGGSLGALAAQFAQVPVAPAVRYGAREVFDEYNAAHADVRIRGLYGRLGCDFKKFRYLLALYATTTVNFETIERLGVVTMPTDFSLDLPPVPALAAARATVKAAAAHAIFGGFPVAPTAGAHFNRWVIEAAELARAFAPYIDITVAARTTATGGASATRGRDQNVTEHGRSVIKPGLVTKFLHLELRGPSAAGVGAAKVIKSTFKFHWHPPFAQAERNSSQYHFKLVDDHHSTTRMLRSDVDLQAGANAGFLALKTTCIAAVGRIGNPAANT